MPIQAKITFSSLKEKKQIEKLADQAGETLSNYIRKQLGLAPLLRGGVRPNAGRPKDKQQKPE